MKNKKNKHKYSITYGIILVYLGIMFFMYPLYYQNYYYDIVTCRFYLFSIMTGITALLCLAGYCLDGGTDKAGTMRSLMNKPDYLVLALWGINLISVLLSDYPQVGIVGTSGRSSGLITLTCYVAIYFMVTRFYRHNVWIYRLLCISSMAASVVGMLHFLDIDFLGFYDGLGMGEKAMYLSTMGHADVVASFYGIVLPMGMVLYINSNSWKEQIFYGITLILSAAGLFATGCESGAIILGIMILAGFVATKDGGRLHYLLFLLCCMLITCKGLLIINERKHTQRKLETFQLMLHNNTIFIILLVILIIMTVAAKIICRRKEDNKGITGICGNRKYIRRILIAVFLFIFAWIGGIIFFSTAGRNINLGRMENMMRFNKRFGSFRGYIWELVVKEYSKLPFIKKLFGIGCDALKPFLMASHRNEMYLTTGAYYDNAHNEFLQYLITTGILGLISYVSLLFIKLRQGICIMIEKNSVLTAAAVFGVLGYLAQSVVDINQCVTTPLFVIMVCMLGCA